MYHNPHLFPVTGQGRQRRSSQPENNLVDLGFRTEFTLSLLDEERVDLGKFHGEDVGAHK